MVTGHTAGPGGGKSSPKADPLSIATGPGNDHWRVALESAGVGLFERNHLTGEGYASPCYYSLLGLPRDAEPGSLAFDDKLDETERVALGRMREKLIRDCGGPFRFSLHPEIDGERKSLSLHGFVEFQKQPDGKMRPFRTYGVLIDHSENHALTEALSAAQRLESVGRMAGMIAHDFNNLLTAILSNLELAGRETKGTVAARDHIDRAIEATRLAAGFVRRLMSLAGSNGDRPQVIEVDRHLVRVWSILTRVLSGDVHARMDSGARRAAVLLDPGELDGAILNLVVNARDAMPKGGEITIRTGRTTLRPAAAAEIAGGRAGDFVTITVADSGKGMTPEVKARALEPFYSTKSSETGTGLGLTSVATTMARANGFLDLQSAPDQGTSVTLYLPFVDRTETDEEDSDSTEPPLGNGELVLVVEDDALVRETVLDRLEALGYAVLEAASVSQALELLDAGEPVDLVFSDVILPLELNGFDLARILREKWPEIPVLLTSGHTSRRIEKSRNGVNDVPLLAKPYSLRSLAVAVSRRLAGR